jgi:hypothetical protein
MESILSWVEINYNLEFDIVVRNKKEMKVKYLTWLATIWLTIHGRQLL